MNLTKVLGLTLVLYVGCSYSMGVGNFKCGNKDLEKDDFEGVNFEAGVTLSKICSDLKLELPDDLENGLILKIFFSNSLDIPTTQNMNQMQKILEQDVPPEKKIDIFNVALPSDNNKVHCGKNILIFAIMKADNSIVALRSIPIMNKCNNLNVDWKVMVSYNDPSLNETKISPGTKNPFKEIGIDKIEVGIETGGSMPAMSMFSGPKILILMVKGNKMNDYESDMDFMARIKSSFVMMIAEQKVMQNYTDILDYPMTDEFIINLNGADYFPAMTDSDKLNLDLTKTMFPARPFNEKDMYNQYKCQKSFAMVIVDPMNNFNDGNITNNIFIVPMNTDCSSIKLDRNGICKIDPDYGKLGMNALMRNGDKEDFKYYGKHNGFAFGMEPGESFDLGYINTLTNIEVNRIGTNSCSAIEDMAKKNMMTKKEAILKDVKDVVDAVSTNIQSADVGSGSEKFLDTIKTVARVPGKLLDKLINNKKFVNELINEGIELSNCAQTLFKDRHGYHGSGHYGTHHDMYSGSGHYGSGHYGTHHDMYSGSGHYGSGDYGSGHYGSGHYGSGHYGSGHYGSGHYGSGHYGSGHHGKYSGSGQHGKYSGSGNYKTGGSGHKREKRDDHHGKSMYNQGYKNQGMHHGGHGSNYTHHRDKMFYKHLMYLQDYKYKSSHMFSGLLFKMKSHPRKNCRKNGLLDCIVSLTTNVEDTGAICKDMDSNLKDDIKKMIKLMMSKSSESIIVPRNHSIAMKMAEVLEKAAEESMTNIFFPEKKQIIEFISKLINGINMNVTTAINQTNNSEDYQFYNTIVSVLKSIQNDTITKALDLYNKYKFDVEEISRNMFEGCENLGKMRVEVRNPSSEDFCKLYIGGLTSNIHEQGKKSNEKSMMTMWKVNRAKVLKGNYCPLLEQWFWVPVAKCSGCGGSSYPHK